MNKNAHCQSAYIRKTLEARLVNWLIQQGDDALFEIQYLDGRYLAVLVCLMEIEYRDHTR